MFKIFYFLLMTTAYFKDIQAYNLVLQLPNYNETENLTVIENYDTENKNNTAGNTTDYFYIDFPRIGYQIFKNKIAQAMEVYESFMNKNPVIIKVDKSNFTKSGTINLNILNNNVSEKVYTNFSDMQQYPETMESPVKVNSTEDIESNVQTILESNNGTKSNTSYSLSVLQNSNKNKTAINENNETINFKVNHNGSVESNETTMIINGVSTNSSNKINETATGDSKHAEVAPVGFFGQIFNSVSNVFSSITSWF